MSWTIKEGYLFKIYPTSEEAKVFDSIEHEGSVIETAHFGFHGTDVSPLDAGDKNKVEYFCDNDDGEGYIVISDSDDAPLLAEGWESEAVEPNGTGDYYADESGYKVQCLELPKFGNHGVYAVNM